jgi:hypothetical protein
MHKTFDAKKGYGGCRFWQLKARQAKFVCNKRRLQADDSLSSLS